MRIPMFWLEMSNWQRTKLLAIAGLIFSGAWFFLVYLKDPGALIGTAIVSGAVVSIRNHQFSPRAPTGYIAEVKLENGNVAQVHIPYDLGTKIGQSIKVKIERFEKWNRYNLVRVSP